MWKQCLLIYKMILSDILTVYLQPTRLIIFDLSCLISLLLPAFTSIDAMCQQLLVFAMPGATK